MENIYPTSTEVGREDTQLCLQFANDSFGGDYPSCMYESPQTTTNRYSVQNSQIITPVDILVGFAPRELFSWHYSMCHCSSRESTTVETIYPFLTKTSTELCCVSFPMSFDYQSVWILLGTNSCTIGFKEN